MSSSFPLRRSVSTYCFGLESLDGLDVSANIVCHGLILLQDFFGLIDDSLVLQYRAVVGEVNGGRLSFKLSVYPLGVTVTLAEGLERRDGLCVRTSLLVHAPGK